MFINEVPLPVLLRFLLFLQESGFITYFSSGMLCFLGCCPLFLFPFCCDSTKGLGVPLLQLQHPFWARKALNPGWRHVCNRLQPEHTWGFCTGKGTIMPGHQTACLSSAL